MFLTIVTQNFLESAYNFDNQGFQHGFHMSNETQKKILQIRV